MKELIVGIILIILTLVIRLFWDKRKILILLKKIKINIFPATFNVAFSIESREWLNSWEYFKVLLKKFNEFIQQENLNTNIKAYNFSDTIVFKDNKEAEKFRNRKDVDLIIWWEFSNDTLKDKNKWKLSSLRLRYTYWILSDSWGNIWKMVRNDISSKFVEKNYWQIYEDDSYNDIELVFTNLSDMALYILSVSLKMRGEITLSINILEKHLVSLKKRSDTFSDYVKFHLCNNYYLIISDILYNNTKYNPKEKHFQWKEYCEKILNIYPNNDFALNNLAYFEYKTWNKYWAKKIVEKQKNDWNKNPSTFANIWFFYLLDNNYKEAYKWYKKFLNFKIEEIDFSPVDVVGFLSIEYKRTNIHWLLFASWFFSYLYGDKQVAKEDLQKFIAKVPKQEARLMHNKSEKFLQYL